MTTIERSEELMDVAVRNLGLALAIFDPLRFRAWAELGLTTAQLRILFLIRAKPGVTAGQLATRVGVTPPTISGIIDRLVRLDLVRREDDACDRRLVRNFLTEAGERCCSRMARGGDAFTRRILAVMSSDDLEALNRGLRAFVEASETVANAEPNLAAVVMPGVASTM